MIKLFLFLISFLINISFADDRSTMSLQDTVCNEYTEAMSEFELTYEEKMQIASSKFESEINKNEQACDPNFTSEKKNTSASSSSGGSSTAAGGITGEQILDSSDSTGSAASNFGSNESVEKEREEMGNTALNKGKIGQNILENGKIPECMSRISGDDEIALQIKESIAMVTDEDQKKELMRAYFDYKGLNIDVDKC